MNEFTIGQRVLLKSEPWEGGRYMVVIGASPHNITCQWLDVRGVEQVGEFIPEALVAA